ncbi:MAG TPA: prepilin-type N-terminal cleavage/methylation domain-containing protein [Chthoniobacteraceae bacterium]|nr:prepilin-type N-terminal cleavage/methylation domain-containing protein [Chthoniobacteraceae bacterium]
MASIFPEMPIPPSSPLPDHRIRSARSRRGLTQVELMVSIVVIGVLASLLVPALLRVRLSSRNLQCVSQLRQCGTAALNYANDRDGVFQSVMGGTIAANFWPNVLYRDHYLSDKNTTRCPSAYASIPIDNAAWMWRAYGLNMQEGPYSKVVSPNHRLRVRAVENPSSYPLILDSFTKDGGTQTFRIGIGKEGAGCHHFGKANVFFLDGHVDALGPQELKDLGFLVYQ